MKPENAILNRHLSRSEVRAIDQLAIDRFAMTGLVLMENAGHNAAEAIDQLVPEGEICILCGKGNNGGDGYVIARHLQLADRFVHIVSVVSPSELSGDAAANHRIAELAQIPMTVALDTQTITLAIRQPSVLVDCLLGTGASGSPREPFATAIRLANDLDAVRIAIDLPSGLDCDSGIPSEPTFRADHTLTFVALKTGFAAESATPYLGEVKVLSIGVPAKLLRDCKTSPTTSSDRDRRRGG